MEKKQFVSSLAKLGVDLNKDQFEQFESYYQNLVSYNEKVNLTAITQKDEVFIKHFMDSLSPLFVCELKENSKLIDIGTGAGFPGIPLKIARPDLKVTLVDSLAKRVVFLDTMIDLLKLKDISSIHERAEILAKDVSYRQGYDTVTSRAVANMPVLLEYMSPFAKVKGKLILLKGARAKEEIDSSKRAMDLLGLKLTSCTKVDLSNDASEHYVVVFEKKFDTPSKYPRGMSQIKKNPL